MKNMYTKEVLVSAKLQGSKEFFLGAAQSGHESVEKVV